MEQATTPKIIQGGMGAGISGWRLARAVSMTGQLGVVAGTALDVILVRRLQVGDPGGHMRRSLARFPIPGVADRLIKRYFVEGGKAEDKRFKAKPMPGVKNSAPAEELVVAANFVEVDLAKEGHSGTVGINYLEKIQLPTLPSLYGAMLAGVNFVLMGAGIPIAIPGLLDQLSQGLAVELAFDVEGAQKGERFLTTFDPADMFDGGAPINPPRPQFLGIVSSVIVANALQRRAQGEITGYIVEHHSAGGHNAPPRGRPEIGPGGEPTYGPRDDVKFEDFVKLGKPFWLAGSYGRVGGLADAIAAGAAGIQVGTAFAYSAESDLRADLKSDILGRASRGEAHTFTDPIASPTGFPFKVVELPGTISDQAVYEARTRVCDLGYLRHAYRKEDGSAGWRCPSEELEAFFRKGGTAERAEGRKCVCNALMANLGLGQVTASGEVEQPLVTSGDDVAKVARFLAEGADSYSAASVVELLLGKTTSPSPSPC